MTSHTTTREYDLKVNLNAVAEAVRQNKGFKAFCILDVLNIPTHCQTLTTRRGNTVEWMGPACAAASFPAAGGASKVSPPSAQLSLLSQCLVEVVNSLVGCRAEGSASAERLLADGGEGGRDCDLSEGGAVLRKGGADSSRSVYHRLHIP